MQVDGYSLDAQRDKLRKYAAYEDMIIAGEYSDEGFLRISYAYSLEALKEALDRMEHFVQKLRAEKKEA